MAHTLHLIELEQITRSKYTILPPIALLLFTARVHAPLEGRLIILVFGKFALKLCQLLKKYFVHCGLGFLFIYIFNRINSLNSCALPL